MTHPDILVIGGGAAGFFAAIQATTSNPNANVCILERAPYVLGKVRISGGGRCNVTHHCFDPSALIRHYPRGGKALIGPFNRFNPKHTVAWFAERGIALKTEADGRMFPVSDSSETIIQCLTEAAKKAGVVVKTKCGLRKLMPLNMAGWRVITSDGQVINTPKILVATGSNAAIWQQLADLGHTIEPPVPSLFTFNTRDTRLAGLAGVSVPHATIRVVGTKLQAEGPLLVTHWGLSGPSILRLSAWGARLLNEAHYRFTIEINFTGKATESEALSLFEQQRTLHPRKNMGTIPLWGLPTRLWQSLTEAAQCGVIRWADVSKKHLQHLAQQCVRATFEVAGKSTNKDEFVTCGGVRLSEVDFRTMESKRFSGLYFAGEVLDVDALTGGFNFQHAWTSGYIAGSAMTSPS
ncbi:MAG: NAD(P)/FAD-dependent oxidoreductase [Bacteroidetes Order II. Incertae sedis bacterium]|nr:NAD(P)/FAD-dependent oxidoreductase [Bacteroidetes Order II. bacterium]